MIGEDCPIRVISLQKKHLSPRKITVWNHIANNQSLLIPFGLSLKLLKNACTIFAVFFTFGHLCCILPFLTKSRHWDVRKFLAHFIWNKMNLHSYSLPTFYTVNFFLHLDICYPACDKRYLRIYVEKFANNDSHIWVHFSKQNGCQNYLYIQGPNKDVKNINIAHN